MPKLHGTNPRARGEIRQRQQAYYRAERRAERLDRHRDQERGGDDGDQADRPDRSE
jgi:hypothetical protein